jgi:hypothetical protein
MTPTLPHQIDNFRFGEVRLGRRPPRSAQRVREVNVAGSNLSPRPRNGLRLRCASPISRDSLLAVHHFPMSAFIRANSR